MSDPLAVMLSFPPGNVAKLSAKEYDKEMHTHLKKINAVSSSAWTKPVGKQSLLDLLNPAVNTIPFILALTEHIKAAGKDRTRQEILLNQAIIFFATFDPVQARYAGDQWVTLLQWTLQSMQKMSIIDLSPIYAAMLRLDPTAGTFTTNHLVFVRACLETGVPSQALPILDQNIYAFPTAPAKNAPEDLLSEAHELSNTFITTKTGFTSALRPENILEYYLLGAHIYIGCRNHSRARLFLEYILLTPNLNHATSALQVEAYKKWVLVGLLAEGRPYPLPRTHDQAVMKSIRAIAKPYDTLVEDFEKRDSRKYLAEADAGTQIWHDDGNLRLVHEAGNALLRYRVIDLQKTYAALPVSRVASHIGFAADVTLQMLQDMIRASHLHASISPGSASAAGDAVLRFHSTSTSTSTSAAQADHDLEAQTLRIRALIASVRDADRRLQLTKEYVEHAKRAKRQSGGPDGDPADQMDLTYYDPPMLGDEGDEDIMAG